METPHWNTILAFDFDAPMSEYGFSTRLAKENFWTKGFTKKAIVEYKKFMFLAATSDMMVSPSEVIDVVWHQHLVFTQSYKEFCDLLGKQIQHVPSTHNKVDFEKFRLAKERTNKLYSATFGEQPADIWQFNSMYDSMQLEKAGIKLRTFILFGLLAIAVLIVPAFILLRPMYVQIDNPDFITYYIFVVVIAFFALNVFNRSVLSRVFKGLHRSCFLFHLDPMEVLYLKTRQLRPVIDGTLNQLMVKQKIVVSDKVMLSSVEGSVPESIEEYQVLEQLNGTKKITYNDLVAVLSTKPVFTNVENTLNAVTKYFVKSKRVGMLFYISFSVLSVVFLLGFVRVLTGVMRDRPVTQISFILFVVAVLIVYFLYRLTRQLVSRIVPKYYKGNLARLQGASNDWEWQYALIGVSVLHPVMYSMVSLSSSSDSSGSSSSSDSSCGSSCSSCGGCGGGGD